MDRYKIDVYVRSTTSWDIEVLLMLNVRAFSLEDARETVVKYLLKDRIVDERAQIRFT